MKTVVCFGDSNTWGLDPATGDRFASELRWTGVLQRGLGPGVRVIEEGLNDRTTNVDDPVVPDRNGATHLPSRLLSHRPIDLLVLMLGTNDLKARFQRSASDIAESAARLAGIARGSLCGPRGQPVSTLLVAPPPVREIGLCAEMFAGAEAKARRLGSLYPQFAAWFGAQSFDAGAVAQVSELDGVHLDADSHRRLGDALAQVVGQLLARGAP